MTAATPSTHADYATKAGYHLQRPGAPHLLLLLHGLGGDRSQPLRLAFGLDRDDITILAPDARAHGETCLIGSASNFTFDAMVADLLALLDRLSQRDKPTYVAGISMGAALSLNLALHGDMDIHGLALVRPAFSDESWPPNLIVMRRIAELLPLGAAGRAQFEASEAYQSIAAVSVSGAASLLDQFDKPHAWERAGRLAYIPANTAWQGTLQLATITAPTLVLGATRDPVHPVELAQRWTDLIPNASYQALPARDDDPVEHELVTRHLVQTHLGVALPPASHDVVPEPMHAS